MKISATPRQHLCLGRSVGDVDITPGCFCARTRRFYPVIAQVHAGIAIREYYPGSQRERERESSRRAKIVVKKMIFG